MKLGFYDDFRPCVVTDRGVVDISRVVRAFQGGSPQLLLENIITNFAFLRPKLEAAAARSKAIPLQEVRLRPPVPRPGKTLMGQGNYMESVTDGVRKPLSLFFKSPDAIIGPGDTVVLPPFEARIFHHEAELALVIGAPAHNVPEARAMEHVFGYLAGVDVSARAPWIGGPGITPNTGEGPWMPGNFGKCFDTFHPIGPWIVTADEIKDPHNLHVQYRVNGQIRHDYHTSDMEHRIPELIATMSSIMTLKPGDLFMCGTNHEGLGPLQDGDVGEIEIDGIGKFSNPVVDELKRSWHHSVDAMAAGTVRERRPPINCGESTSASGRPKG